MRLQVERKAGSDALCLGLIVGDRRCLVVLDAGPKIGYVSGLEMIDGRHCGINETTKPGQVLTDGKSSDVLCTVSREGIVVVVDGKPVMEYMGRWDRLSLGDFWNTPNPRTMILGSQNSTTYQITRMELTAITQAERDVVIKRAVAGRFKMYCYELPGINSYWQFTDERKAIQDGAEVGTWTLVSGKITIRYSNKEAGLAVLEFKDTNTLQGSNRHKNGALFQWVLERRGVGVELKDGHFRVGGRLTKDDVMDRGRVKDAYQVHSVKLVTGTNYTIDVSSGDFSPGLILQDSSGKKVANYSEGVRNVCLTFRAPKDDTYHIIVRRANPPGDGYRWGEYTLVVRSNEAAEKAERERLEAFIKAERERQAALAKEKAEALAQAKKDKDYLPSVNLLEAEGAFDGVKALLGQPTEVQRNLMVANAEAVLVIWNRGKNGYVAIYFVNGVRGGILGHGVNRQEVDRLIRIMKAELK